MKIIGHRGAKGLAPENTIAGIEYALSLHVDWIEFDVHASKDGELVVLHDTTVNRITAHKGKVRDFTHEQLKKIATKSGEPIPTFQQVMETIGDKAKINIEIKSGGCAEKVVAYINEQLAAGRSSEDFLISSFKVKYLREVFALAPHIRLGLLHSYWPFKFMHTLGLPLAAVGFYQLSLPQVAIKEAKRRNIWIYAYTVNSKQQARQFEKLGVDAIVTDVPQNFKNHRPLFLALGLGILFAISVGLTHFILTQ